MTSLSLAQASTIVDVALKRFPVDRKGQLTHMLAMSVTDSVWHKQLSGMETGGAEGNRDLYWLGPFIGALLACNVYYYLIADPEER